MSPMAPLRGLRPGLVVRLDLDQRPDEHRIDAVGLRHGRDDLAVGGRLEQLGRHRLAAADRPELRLRLGVRHLVRQDLVDEGLVAP